MIRQRNRDHGDQSQQWANQKHHDQNKNKRGYRIDCVHDSRAQHWSHSIKIIGQPRHDIPRAVSLIVGIWQGLKLGKKIIAHVIFNQPGNHNNRSSGEETEETKEDSHCDNTCSIFQELVDDDIFFKIIDGMTDYFGVYNTD